MFLRLPIIVFVVLLVGFSSLPMTQGVEEYVPSYACVFQMTFRTNSDWSKANMTGIGRVLISEYEILQGEDAPDLSVPAASPSLILVGKRQYDTTPVELRIRAIILDPADEVVLTVTKGHIGKTEIVLYKWKDGGFEFFGQYVHEGVNWTEPIENPAQFRFNVSQLWETKISVELKKLPTDADKLVLAFYYPWYGSPYGPSGRWYHWEDVKEGSISNSAHFPVFGAYDSRDERMIEAQILLARYVGIDGFISSWWGPDSFEDQTFQIILKVAERLGFKVTIYYESYRSWDPLLDPALIADELAYVVEKYSNSSAFLKIGGSPVIFVYSVEAHNRGPGFWFEVRNILEEKVGKVFLVGDLRNPAYLSVFDGFHIYIELDSSTAQSIYKMFSEQMGIGTDALTFEEALREIETTGRLVIREKLICGTVIPGYDDGRSPGAFVGRKGGETYRAYWQVARDSHVDCVLITSWNEWHEGTEIEPSVEYGFQYLIETRKLVTEFKNISLPEYNGEPDLRRVVNFYENPDTLEVALENKGDGHAVAVRLETDLGESNANVLSSSPYPHEDSNITNYIPLIHPGESVKVNVTLSGVTEDSIVVNSLSIRYFSVSGEEISEAHTVKFHKMSLEMPLGTGVRIDNATVTGSEAMWLNEGETVELHLALDVFYINENRTRLVFKGWGGDVNSSEKHLTLVVSSPLHIEAEWTRQHLIEAYSDYSQVDGSGWYDEGEEATISIKETSLGFLFKQVFRRWEGDYSSTSQTLTIRVSGPVRLVAVWETEIDTLMILVFVIIVIAALGVLLYVKRSQLQN